MTQKVYFFDMFSDYEPPEELRAALSQAAVAAADIDAQHRRISVALESDFYVPRRILDQVAREISKQYGLSDLELKAAHPETELQKIEPEELRDLFVTRNSMARGSLAGARWLWNGTELTVQLAANGKKELEELVPQVQNVLREQFAAPVPIKIEAGKTLEGKALFEAMESMRYSVLETASVAVAAKKEENKPDPQSETFFGKPFKGNVTPVKELNLDMGSVIVEGKVFAMEHKELKKRNAWVISFDMTDNYGSVRINVCSGDSRLRKGCTQLLRRLIIRKHMI